MKNLVSYSDFVFEVKSTDKEGTPVEIAKSEVPIPEKKETPFNLDNLKEVLLTESAVSADDLKENIGIMQRKKLGEKSVLLYDFKDSKILGYAHLRKFGNESHYEIEKIVAEEKYGPVVSDFTLMSVYPEGVGPSAKVSPSELKVWYYYLTLREDVKKKMIPKDDRKVAIKSDYAAAGLSEEEALEIVNTQFFLEPTSEFQKIIREEKERDSLLKEVKNYLKNR